MRYVILLAIFLGYTAYGVSQTENRFNLGLTFTPCLSDYILVNDGTIPKEVVSVYKDIEIPKLSWYSYIYAQYRLTSRIKMQMGLGWFSTGNKDKKLALRFAAPEPGDPEYHQTIRIQENIILPIMIRYYFMKQRNSLFTSCGIIPSFYIAQKEKSIIWYKDGKKRNVAHIAHPEYRRTNLRYTFGIGYEKSLSRKLNMFVMPSFDADLFEVLKKTPINRKGICFSLNIGLALK